MKKISSVLPITVLRNKTKTITWHKMRVISLSVAIQYFLYIIDPFNAGLSVRFRVTFWENFEKTPSRITFLKTFLQNFSKCRVHFSNLLKNTPLIRTCYWKIFKNQSYTPVSQTRWDPLPTGIKSAQKSSRPGETTLADRHRKKSENFTRDG